MLRRPTARALTVLAALPLTALAGCGSASGPGGSAGSATPTAPSPSSSPTSQPGGAVSGLAAAKAAWAASPASSGEYQLRVVRGCFCAPVGVDVTVRDGKVVAENAFVPGGSDASPSADPAIPRTVEDLFDVIEGNADGYRTVVTYARVGVPLRIALDPIKNAADDESTYTVVFSTMEGEPAPAARDASWTRQDPTGTPPGLDSTGLPETGSVAYVDGTGPKAVLRLGLWGSGSCPSRPVTLLPGVSSDGLLAVTVDVDDTQPAGTACTADYGPTWYAAPVPDDVAKALSGDVPDQVSTDGTLVELVLEAVVGSTGSTGSSARSVAVLR